MTTAQDRFIDALAAKAQADPRVRAAWLAGSYGKENADRWSDVDAHLLIAPEAQKEFHNGVERWLGEIQPLVFVRLMFDGRMVNAMTDQAMRLDVWLHNGETAEVTSGETRTLFESRPGTLVWLPYPGDALIAEEAGEMLRREIPEFWRSIAMMPVVVGREEKLVSAAGNSLILLTLSNVLCAAGGRRRDRGIKALNGFLLPHLRRRLEEAVFPTSFADDDVVRFPLRLARIMRDYGPEICERWEVEYPHAMEKTVLRYVAQELCSLGREAVLEELD